MRGWIGNVQIGVGDGPAYQREGGALAELYGALLGMERYNPGYIKLRGPGGTGLEIGFENGDDVRPRWPDPAYPQQMHLDIEVQGLDAADAVARRHGATLLQDDAGTHRVYADPVGHPFCLYPAPTGAAGAPPGRIARIVVDCPDPRRLAPFYADLLGLPTRTMDTDERVELAGDDPLAPALAFQSSPALAPRWPDPARPAQLHLDLCFDDAPAAARVIERLGAVRLASLPLHAVFADPAGHPFCGPASGYVTVRSIPAGVLSMADFPPDWRPGPLPLDRAEAIEALLDFAPDADFSDPGHGRLARDGVHLEFTIPDRRPLTSFTIAFGTADRAVADPLLRSILDRLGLRAFDADAPGQIFV